MADESIFSRDEFHRVAKFSGLDVNDQQHMDDLYAFLQTLLPALQKVWKLEAGEAEPAPIWVPT